MSIKDIPQVNIFKPQTNSTVVFHNLMPTLFSMPLFFFPPKLKIYSDLVLNLHEKVKKLQHNKFYHYFLKNGFLKIYYIIIKLHCIVQYGNLELEFVEVFFVVTQVFSFHYLYHNVSFPASFKISINLGVQLPESFLYVVGFFQLTQKSIS